MNESGNKGDKTKSKKKKPKPPNQANLTVAESADQYFTECNYDVMMLQIFRNRVDHKVPKGGFVYDAGADVHVCNDELLFVPNEPPEYTTVTGVEGKSLASSSRIIVGLVGWHRFLLLALCFVPLVAGFVHVFDTI